jgi:hypothetical protein
LIAAAFRRNARRSAPWLLRAGLLLLWASGVWAAERSKLDPASIPLPTWALVLVLTVVGYLASSAEMLFGWVEARSWRSFGRIVQSFFCAVAAGGTAYLSGVYFDASPIVALLGVVPAAYAGETYMRKFIDKRESQSPPPAPPS